MAGTQGPDGKFITALTRKRHTAIVGDVRRGLFDAQIAYKNGVDVTTLKSWIDRGLDEDAPEQFRDFAQDYITAAIELEERTIGVILEAASPWEKTKETNETSSYDDDADCDSSDVGPGRARKTHKKEKTKERGDWRAAAFFLERRWPLRWGITRQPEGGPKEAIQLPEGAQVRRKRVEEMTGAPPPELIKAFRAKGWEIVRREEKG